MTISERQVHELAGPIILGNEPDEAQMDALRRGRHVGESRALNSHAFRLSLTHLESFLLSQA